MAYSHQKRDRLIYLIRHGEPAFPNIRKGKQYIGQTDLEISSAGISQAEKLAKGLKRVDVEAVFTSDLKRAKKTADIAAEPHNIKPITDTGLREISLGDWEGRYFSDVKKENPEDFKRRGEDLEGFKPPRGESFIMFIERIIPAFERIINSVKGDIMIVSHSGVNRAILCHLLGMTIRNQFKLRQDYCCVNVLRQQRERIVVELANYVFNNRLF